MVSRVPRIISTAVIGITDCTMSSVIQRIESSESHFATARTALPYQATTAKKPITSTSDSSARATAARFGSAATMPPKLMWWRRNSA